MARQLENWIETTTGTPNPEFVTVSLEKLQAPFSLEWYRSDPRLTTDRLMKFEGKAELTLRYDKGDL
ncbi:MAG: hypothetical protein ACXWKG_17415 [Limisphaerales bacterium]